MKSLLHIPDAFLRELNILDWGYTEDPFPASYQRFDTWTGQDLHGPLNYLSDHRKDLRRDLRKVYPPFQSALVFLFSYRETKKWMLENARHEIASCALGFGGEDYHFTLKARLLSIAEKLKDQKPELDFFVTLDAQPVLERDLAYRAGLGWFGKNSMLISRQEGSHFIIGSLLFNQKFPLESPAMDVDHCGTCNACAEACPTDAIDPVTRTLRASDCISTFTIEVMKEAEPPAGYLEARGEVFGCDICQDVCPWNKKPLERTEADIHLSPQYAFLKPMLYQQSKRELKLKLEAMTNRGFQKVMSGTALSRPGRKGWLKNLI